MKEYFIDTHSSLCPCSSSNAKGWELYCSMNPERFLFFAGTKFFIVTYHNCITFGDKYGFKKNIIDNAITQSKVFESWLVNISVDLNKDLVDFRIRNKNLRKYIQQVNYIYKDNAGKKYAITTKTNYLDSICNQEEIRGNYEKTKDFIIKNNYDWMLCKLDELYIHNIIREANPIEIHKTIDSVIKSINQLTK